MITDEDYSGGEGGGYFQGGIVCLTIKLYYICKYNGIMLSISINIKTVTLWHLQNI